MKRVRAYLTLLRAYMRVNWRSALEYRTNFIFGAVLSLLEVGMYLFYWKMFFSISGGVPGSSFEQIAALVAFNHVIYAGADTLMGDHVWEAVDQIITGQLDVFLAQPKSPVFQLFFSGAQPMRAIQIVVGTFLYFSFMSPTLYHIGMYLFGLVVGTVIFSSWVIAIHALTFRLGNSVVIYRLLSTILHFAKKPADIFSFGVRFVLYTVIPAAYLGTVQARQLASPDPLWIIGLIALTIASPCFAFWIFRRSMRLYESGNLIGVRM
jgi:ABC-2 type transport system permease protein